MHHFPGTTFSEKPASLAVLNLQGRLAWAAHSHLGSEPVAPLSGVSKCSDPSG